MPQVANVNTTDIRAAIALGCRSMQRVFNADDRDIPYFGSSVRSQASLSFSPAHSESHVPGRHLNALLNAQDACGIDLDESAVTKHANAAYFSYSGSIPFPLNRETIDGPLVNFLAHNLREGFHALYALAKYRRDARAVELAQRSIDAIWKYWTPDLDADSGGRWDTARLQADHGLTVNTGTFITGEARAIGPLVKLYRATGLTSALDLAIALKNVAIEHFFTASGGYDRDHWGTHTHSATCVMSSLAQLADLTGDGPLLERVRAFYDHGLNDIRDAIGWVIESTRDDRHPDRGEANNTGDIVETALILGRHGFPRYYHDAERILRCHLLPSQLRDVSFIKDPDNPQNLDSLRDMADRHLGAFGFPAPYGHTPVGRVNISFNMDIVGGAVASLCEAYRDITRRDDAGHWVNLLFDHHTEQLTVESAYMPKSRGVLRVTVHQPAPLWIRIPPWADRALMHLPCAHRSTGDHLFIPTPPLNTPLTLAMPLPARELVLNHRTRQIRVHLRGDSVAAMDNFRSDLAFFPSLPI